MFVIYYFQFSFEFVNVKHIEFDSCKFNDCKFFIDFQMW